ncbi:MAG: helix-turn-helix transcriptional regulator [Saprospiraceae bacterium]
MIREDRIQLNERFIKVFNLLKEKGDIILNDRNGRGIGDFAEKILGNKAYGHIVRAFLNEKDKRVIDYRQARIVCREYGVNESYLIDGIGTPFGFETPKPRKSAESGQIFIPQGNIMYTSTQAFAGSGQAASDTASEDNYFFSIPNLSGNGLVAFPIQGNSMEPVIKDGDTLICREIAGVSEIRDNQIYAVKANGALWVKYVKKIVNSKGKVTQLRLVSANNLEFDAFEEEVNEATRLYKVVRRISDVN